MQSQQDDGMSLPDLIKKETIRKAIQCALEIQKHMDNMQILPGLTLSVKVKIRITTFQIISSSPITFICFSRLALATASAACSTWVESSIALNSLRLVRR